MEEDDIGNVFGILARDMREHVYDNTTVRNVLAQLVEFQAVRDKAYGRSWAKRGLLGYWSGGIGRRADRLDPAFQELLTALSMKRECSNSGEVMAVFESLVDVCCYAAMGICLMSAMFPDGWDAMQKEMADKAGR